MKTTKATWIWYPGDFEIWLGNIFNNRRTERGAMFPPFWKQDSHYPTVEFSTKVNLKQEEVIAVWAEGTFNFALDGKLISEVSAPANTFWYEESEAGDCYRIRIPQGEHALNLKVWNQQTPPAIFIKGKTIQSNNSWLATYEDKLWIDENGVAHGSGIYVPAASWNFDEPNQRPSHYSLKWREQHPVSCETIAPDKKLYDFGCETFGHLDFRNVSGQGTAFIYYGESREEALDKEYCETLDMMQINNGKIRKPLDSKAFRYVYIESTGNINYQLSMYEEYAPYDPNHTGSFRCSDDELNRIWDTAARTMDLTTQEFFMDGIKRDRWTWSGDAIQSYLMNYYLRFDTECVKRTIRQLRGKDPVTAHVNTIMDYTFYWFKSVLDYYHYTADVHFVREMWPRMVTLMDYTLSRTNADGMAEGQADDWIFVDWVDFPMHKRGALCFEQILLYKALETMAQCARLLSEDTAYAKYSEKAASLLHNIKETFWNDDAHAYLHAMEDGQLNRQITKFPNMFAILYGLSDEAEQKDIMENVMLNPNIDPITTPYMRFYELEALCMAGLQKEVLAEVRSYWGGMLKEGATSFWEKYVPSETGTQHLAMYGRPYGKSLCHAWGASPVYLLGKYYLGVQPTKPGYQEYEVRPSLGDLDWMEGDVPTPHGMIHVYMDKQQVKVNSTEDGGWLVVAGQKIRIEANKETIVRL
ncbi:MAG: alpha-rhamnosidase [Prevotella sp.]|nr:alpha-rhamnosidase [Prevotella sp.]